MQQTAISTNKRTNIRVPASAVTVIKDLDSVTGSIKDISASGVRIQIQNTEKRKFNNLNIEIPILHNQEISGEIRWHKKIEGNEGNIQYGLEFKNLTNSQKKAIRKTILMDEALLFKFAEKMTNETDNPDLKEKIKIFFLIDVRTKLEKMIEVYCATESGNKNNTLRKGSNEKIIRDLAVSSRELKNCFNNTEISEKIDEKVQQLLNNFIKSENDLQPMSNKQTV